MVSDCDDMAIEEVRKDGYYHVKFKDGMYQYCISFHGRLFRVCDQLESAIVEEVDIDSKMETDQEYYMNLLHAMY